jgi:protein-disulfide isomerase
MASLKAIWAAGGLLLITAAHAASSFDPRLGAPLTARARPTLGSDQATLVVIEVSSFQCPHCLEFRNDTFPALDAQYIKTGKVQWVIVNAAPDADVAREPVFAIGKCLDRQKRYAAFADLLYNNGTLPQDQILQLLTQRGGLDAPALSVCLHDPAIAKEIDADFADYQKLKVTGTPTFILRKLRKSGAWSGARIVGNLPLDYFQRTFDTMLKLP